jgi:hypothetical protein
MAKDYFQDIVPPNEDSSRMPRQSPQSTRKVPMQPASEFEAEDASGESPERSIRNIDAPERRVRPSRPPVNDVRDPANFGVQQLPPKPRRPGTRRSWWLWVIAAVVVVVLAGLALFAFRKTTVTVTPRSHVVVFDQTSQFTAYPAVSAATGTLAYTVINSDLQASQTVTAGAMQEVQTKAQGSITVYNDYSTSPVKLIANTRFATPSGLIFRVPDVVVVPGKSGSTPGHVSVTVFADQPGDQYNVGPVSRFTVPGLQSTPAMYANIYAQSTASTTGGFAGQQAAVDPTTLSNTQSALRGELAQEAQAAASAQSGTTTIVLPQLVKITYQDLPQTTAASGSVQVNEEAHIQTPVFDTSTFTQAIAQDVGESSDGVPLSLVEGQGFSSQSSDEASTTLGTDPLDFSLLGTATLVWQVDAKALAQALAGHDQNSFGTITATFPGIQEARSRIEPFWNTAFPSNPADISVVVEPPQASK